MSDEKWITGLAPETSAADAAHHVLSLRLTAVAARLAPAVERAGEDPEHVHQLRVATRRASAALRIFAECLPEARFDTTRKLLRAVRRAAGDARDWDVFAENVRGTDHLIGLENEPARSYLLGLAAGCRGVAQAKLRIAADGHRADLDEAVVAVPDEVRPPESSPGLTAGDLAAEQLAELFAEFTGRIADGPRSAAALHQLRIAGKRLRYAIEVFAGCFPPPLKGAYYPAVEEAQEILGRVNDAHVAVDRLAAIRGGLRKVAPALAPTARPGLDALIAGVRADATTAKAAFRRWCREWALTRAEYPLGEVLRVPAVEAA